ncbi:hypothetical protein [Methanolapillus millepedarum]|uniref:Uncharacterized protein n=1 Tax=Methanolapillus millepedarum TaxID=3028296 RepID=A0AA96V3F1_9EURY|nr:hypothetical protein MsAc7_07070 [Methanosarcinaceae archaeon Ac7]
MKAVEVYEDSLIKRLQFEASEVMDADKTVSINQIEMCWNQELPYDTVHYLSDKFDFFVENGLETVTLHSETPLLVTKYHSDIDPTEDRMAHKIYKKSKKILRNEIVLGNELKTDSPISNQTLSDFFFTDSQTAKKFVYFKFILQYLRNTVGIKEEKYWHGYKRFISERRGDEEWKTSYLQAVLGKSGINKAFQDVEFFDVFVDHLEAHGCVQRRFFKGWTDKKYRVNVVESREFERKGRGKYRPQEISHLFKIVCEYRKHREYLRKAYPDNIDALAEIYHPFDTGIQSGLSQNK